LTHPPASPAHASGPKGKPAGDDGTWLGWRFRAGRRSPRGDRHSYRRRAKPPAVRARQRRNALATVGRGVHIVRPGPNRTAGRGRTAMIPPPSHSCHRQQMPDDGTGASPGSAASRKWRPTPAHDEIGRVREFGNRQRRKFENLTAAGTALGLRGVGHSNSIVMSGRLSANGYPLLLGGPQIPAASRRGSRCGLVTTGFTLGGHSRCRP